MECELEVKRERTVVLDLILSFHFFPTSTMSASQGSGETPVGFVTLGMFIIDEFSFSDDEGIPTGRTLAPQERPSVFGLQKALLIPLV
jgi:hypothetical protein